jgi:hypothetical protein
MVVRVRGTARRVNRVFHISPNVFMSPPRGSGPALSMSVDSASASVLLDKPKRKGAESLLCWRRKKKEDAARFWSKALPKRVASLMPSGKQETESGTQEPFSLPLAGFFGRPGGRSLASRPRLAAVASTLASLPNGWPRRTLRRNASNSPAVCGQLTFCT